MKNKLTKGQEKSNGEHKKDCEWPLEVKEVKMLFMRCRRCGYFKTLTAEKDWKTNELERQ